MDSATGSVDDEPVVYGAMPPTQTKEYSRTKKVVKYLVSERAHRKSDRMISISRVKVFIS